MEEFLSYIWRTLALVIGVATHGSAGYASAFSDQAASPLVGPSIITFDGAQNPGVGAFHFVTTELSTFGVTFSALGFRYQPGTNLWPSQTDAYLIGTVDDLHTKSIFFTSDASAVGFSYLPFPLASPQNTTFSTYLDGSLVETFTVMADSLNAISSGKFYGFQGSLFDELRITSDGYNLDNLQFVTAQSSVPLPASLPLFVTGLGIWAVRGWRARRQAA